MEEAAFELGLDTRVGNYAFVAAGRNICSGPIICPSLCWNWDRRDDWGMYDG